MTIRKQVVWKPIETAPRDGTEIIVSVEIADTIIVRSARWVPAENWMDKDSQDIDTWWSYKNSVTQEELVGVYTPTHWIEMPEYPSETTKTQCPECDGEDFEPYVDVRVQCKRCLNVFVPNEL